MTVRGKDGACANCRTDAHMIMDYTQGDLVCRNCGLVSESRIIDDQPEWRSFASESAGSGAAGDKNRAGTVVDNFYHDTGSTSIGGSTMLAKAQQMISDPKDRALRTCHSNLSTIVDACGMKANVMSACLDMVKSIEEKEMLKGKTNMTNMCAVVYMVCRDMQNAARSLREIAACVSVVHATGLSTDQFAKEIGRCMMKFRTVIQSTSRGHSAEDLVARFVNHLNMDFQVTKLAEQICKNAAQWSVVASKWPQNLAASAVYLAANLVAADPLPTAAEVADVAKIKENTMKSTYKQLRDAVTQILPKDFIPKVELASLPK